MMRWLFRSVLLLAIGGCAGHRASLYGSEVPARNIVYVLECSGGLTDRFDEIQDEVLRSIGRLKQDQFFHVIVHPGDDHRTDEEVFSGRPVPVPPRENPPRALVTATPNNVAAAGKFLGRMIPQSGPDSIPAVRRAFEVLGSPPPEQAVIFLTVDRHVRNGRGLAKACSQLNRGKRIQLHIFLLDGADLSKKFLKKLAEDNGGRLTLFEVD